ncbi:MAG: WD40 repeat domain-containing protein [Chloroflexota bacterium]|nr:WD40 repeat domain-containing protein [Chloroflexota bacterium]
MIQTGTENQRGHLVLRHVLDAEAHDLRAVAWSPRGDSLLGIAANGSAWLWDGATGEVRWRVKHAPGVPSCLRWSPDGRYWVVGTWQGPVQMLGAGTGTPYETFRGLNSGVIGLEWSPTGDYVLAVSQDAQVAQWEIYSGMALRARDHATDGGVTLCAAWSPDRRFIAIASATGDVECRQATDWRLVWSTPGEGAGSANCVAWSADGLTLVRAAEGHIVDVWSVEDALRRWFETGQHVDPWRTLGAKDPLVRRLGGLGSGASWASLSADGRLLAVRTRAEALRLWRRGTTDQWQEMATVPDEPGAWAQGPLVAFHPCAPQLATVVGGGSVVHVWDIAQMEPESAPDTSAR